MEMDKIKELIQLMKENDLKILRLEDEDSEIYLEAHAKDGNPAPVNQPVQEVNNIVDSTSNDLIEIRAQQIGVFYTQPDEESTDTFVQVGDKVEVGDQIGLIEIMKLFNEVRTDHAGIIEEILVANGESVEYDQVLMLLKPEGE